VIKVKKTLATIALLGAAGAVQAAPATMVGMISYSPNGTIYWNLGSSSAQWDLDLTGGTLTQTSGTFRAQAFVNGNLLMTHTMTGGVLGSGTAVATSWACIEGTFGGTVGSSICGNYSFGGNYANESTYTPTATGATVTIGGDDAAIGAPQTLANSYSGLAMTNLGGGYWRLASGIVGVSGYDFCFQPAIEPVMCLAPVPIPPAVWLFGSALGLMGWMRRKVAA
jgi:hypothetical protein